MVMTIMTAPGLDDHDGISYTCFDAPETSWATRGCIDDCPGDGRPGDTGDNVQPCCGEGAEYMLCSTCGPEYGGAGDNGWGIGDCDGFGGA